MVVLSVNAGSSSLKVSVFETDQLDVPKDSLSLEGIGVTNTTVVGAPASFEEAVQRVGTWLSTNLGIHPGDVEAIGYRVVHGGERYAAASKVDSELLDYLQSITPLAPNHMPAALTTINAFLAAYPNTLHVSCFDTSFFHDLPDTAKVLPIPLSLQKEAHIRRYGFHGLAYQGLLTSFRAHEGEAAARGRIIMAHLGSGASITACVNGAPIDTSMGFTPVSGIMMSTRSGDIEPGVITFLEKEKGMSSDEITELMTYKSGLLGVSGLTADMYTLLQTQHENPSVALAVELFCYKIKKTIGGYAAALGGIDSIIFSGGIGERSDEIRARICEGLEFMGLAIDSGRNASNQRCISADNSDVGVHVIPAQEERSIVTQTLEIMNQGGQ